MFINSIGHYLPSTEIPNEYFKKLNGLTDEWIVSRTGIKTRRRSLPEENTNTMAIEAVRSAIKNLPYDIKEVDLIVGATYTPYDTVGTLAHEVQNEFNIPEAKVISVSSACSSYINAIEIVEGYFAMNKATKALVVASENNSAYSNDEDQHAGHLWGDGSAATFISKDRLKEDDIEIVEIITKGHGHTGRSTVGVSLFPKTKGIVMPYGKDVFIHACTFMKQITELIVTNNKLTIPEIAYIIPHQANIRIINNVMDALGIEDERVVINVDRLGNTGCASSVIGLSENVAKMKKGDYVVLTVFGGGYSCGATLLRI